MRIGYRIFQSTLTIKSIVIVIKLIPFPSYTHAVSPENGVTITSVEEVYDEGDNVTFTCTDLGGPYNSIQWQKNGQDLNETNNLLTLTNVTLDGDGAVYTCIANNSAGMGSANITLKFRLIIDLHPMDANSDNNEIVTFSCSARAFPHPVYVWLRVGEELPDSAMGGNTSMLTLSPAHFGDQGDYFCNATSGNLTLSSNLARLTSKPYTMLFILSVSN